MYFEKYNCEYLETENLTLDQSVSELQKYLDTVWQSSS